MLNTLSCEFMLISTYCFVPPSCCHFSYETKGKLRQKKKKHTKTDAGEPHDFYYFIIISYTFVFGTFFFFNIFLKDGNTNVHLLFSLRL